NRLPCGGAWEATVCSDGGHRDPQNDRAAFYRGGLGATGSSEDHPKDNDCAKKQGRSACAHDD
ncbi:MAG TPA: hypothetical protein VHC01_01605, partial [Gaiellaceae bacterium]|nr:hypothetical protein [Gaiellaceae bacterium]